VRVSANGRHLPHETESGQVWVITPELLTICHAGPNRYAEFFSYRLDLTVLPNGFDVSDLTADSRDGSFRGVCELRGRRLKVCRSRGRRPASLDDDGLARGEVLFVLERQK